MKKLLLLCVMSMLFVACGHERDAKKFEKLLESSTGQDHSVAKLYTETGDYIVFKNEVTGEYVAYNMDKFDRKKMTTLDQFMSNATDGVDVVRNLSQFSEWIEDGYWEDEYSYYTEYYEYYDEECDCYYEESYTYEVYEGSYWVDTSHWYTYFTGGGFRFDNTSSQTKDLETLAALKEDVAEKFLADKMSSEFSLSSNRAAELAKLATRYQKLDSNRELTSSEKDEFAMEALGVSMNQVEAAMKDKASGQEESYEKLLETAAQVNKTTPEQIGKFFNEFVVIEE